MAGAILAEATMSFLGLVFPADRQLGFDAERWALTLVRLAPPCIVPSGDGNARCLSFNFIRMRCEMCSTTSRIEAGL
jgi:hypothetical protein